MINAIIGGSLIGIAASMMLLFNGKITGISGILGGFLNPEIKDRNWRIYFLLGLLSGGLLLRYYAQPEVFSILTEVTRFDYIIAGFLVGFGTLLGSGCTSGHGVCGISRFSTRSLVATGLFISSGIFSAYIFRIFRGEF